MLVNNNDVERMALEILALPPEQREGRIYRLGLEIGIALKQHHPDSPLDQRLAEHSEIMRAVFARLDEMLAACVVVELARPVH